MSGWQTDSYRMNHLRELVDQHLARMGRTNPPRPASAPETRGGSSLRCSSMREERAYRLQQLQSDMMRDVNAKGRRPMSARASKPLQHMHCSVPATPRAVTPLFESRPSTARGVESRGSVPKETPLWSHACDNARTDDDELRPPTAPPLSADAYRPITPSTPPLSADAYRPKTPATPPLSADAYRPKTPATPPLSADACRPKTPATPPLSADATRPTTPAERQDDDCISEALESVTALRLDSWASTMEDKLLAATKPTTPAPARRFYGPKATRAAAAAARANASFQVKLAPSKKIGQDMKKTHFDLTDISEDAITRGQGMESTYRRTFTWNLRSRTEDSARLNPRNSSFLLAKSVTASV